MIRPAVRRVIVASAFTTLLAANAFAQKIAIEFDEAVDFSKFKTFAIRDGVLRSPSPSLNSELTKKHLDAAIEGALSAKGLAKN